MYVRPKTPKVEAYLLTSENVEWICNWLGISRSQILWGHRDDDGNPQPELRIPCERMVRGLDGYANPGNWIVAGVGGRGMVQIYDDKSFHFEFEPDLRDPNGPDFWNHQMKIITDASEAAKEVEDGTTKDGDG